MLELLILAVTRTLVIGLRGKSTQAFVVDKDAEGVDSEQGNVDTQIKLEIVDEQGVVDIVADDQ